MGSQLNRWCLTEPKFPAGFPCLEGDNPAEEQPVHLALRCALKKGSPQNGGLPFKDSWLSLDIWTLWRTQVGGCIPHQNSWPPACFPANPESESKPAPSMPPESVAAKLVRSRTSFLGAASPAIQRRRRVNAASGVAVQLMLTPDSYNPPVIVQERSGESCLVGDHPN